MSVLCENHVSIDTTVNTVNIFMLLTWPWDDICRRRYNIDLNLTQHWYNINTTLTQHFCNVDTTLSWCWHNTGTTLTQFWQDIVELLCQCWASVSVLCQCHVNKVLMLCKNLYWQHDISTTFSWCDDIETRVTPLTQYWHNIGTALIQHWHNIGVTNDRT